jgi:alpha-galactosidase
MFESIIREPDFISVKGEGFLHTVRDGGLLKDDVSVRTRAGEEGLKIFVGADKTPLCYIRLRWNFESALRGHFLGDEWERGYGGMKWEGMVPNRAMPWYFLVKNGDEAAGYGVKVRPGAMCFWQADTKGVSLWLDVRNGGDGVILSGRELTAAVVVFERYSGESAYSAARSFCKLMCDDPIFPDKPVYGANNWYYAYGKSSESEILDDAGLLSKLTEGLSNRPYMVIDDCWQKNRSDEYIGGPWLPNEKFPDMKVLAEKIKELDCIPGIWVRFLLDDSREIPAEWRLSHNGALDPSHPEVIAHIRKDIELITGWGYRLIKHDFSTQDIFGKWGFEMQPFVTEDGWHFYDRSKTSAEIIINFYREILEGAKKTGTLILGCNAIGHLGAGLMHMNRTGDDTSGIRWETTLKMGVNTLAFRMPQHKTFYDVDADCLGITEHIPWKFNRMWGDLLANSGTPLFVSAKPGVLTEFEEKELADFFALSSKQEHIAEPLDWEETTLPEDWKIGECLAKFDWFEDEGINYIFEH